MYVRLLRTRSHHGRKIWVISTSHTDPRKIPSTLLILGPLDVHVASFPCPHNIYTHPGFSTLCTSSAYFLPLFFLQGILPFPQLALSTRRRGWMGTGNARFLALPLSVSIGVCVCGGGVCDIHLRNQHTFTQPPSHADLHIESVLLIFEWPEDRSSPYCPWINFQFLLEPAYEERPRSPESHFIYELLENSLFYWAESCFQKFPAIDSNGLA